MIVDTNTLNAVIEKTFDPAWNFTSLPETPMKERTEKSLVWLTVSKALAVLV